jgi:hypothetical protein
MKALDFEKLSRFSRFIQETKKIKYSHEIALLDGKHVSVNTHRSILFYSTFKCASVYVTDILRKLTKSAELTPINWNDYAWETGESKKKLQNQTAFNPKIFRTVGYFYGCLREFNEWQIPNLDQFSILLMLRDPRDVLTSLYFSHAYSHAIPLFNQEELLELRQRALSMTVDEYVIENIPRYSNIYQEYCLNLLSRSNVLFVTYEKMVTDFEAWLDSITNFLELQISSEVIEVVKEQADFTVNEENIYVHKRQVFPGEHRRKLRTETIKLLNDNFSETLKLLGYTDF